MYPTSNHEGRTPGRPDQPTPARDVEEEDEEDDDDDEAKEAKHLNEQTPLELERTPIETPDDDDDDKDKTSELFSRGILNARFFKGEYMLEEEDMENAMI